MRVNRGDTDSDRSGASSAHGQDIHRAGDAAVHELNESRINALRLIDETVFSWFHFKVCLVAGTGFFTDAYDIFAINLASVMLMHVYGHRTAPSGLAHQLSRKQDFGIRVAAPIGNLFGQMLFGWLADIVERRRMYGIELMIIVTATFTQALSGSGPGVNIASVLIAWRFIMGVGMGGGHLLNSAIASEFASMRNRGRLMSTMFTAQGWGNFVALVTVLAYKDSIIRDSFDQPQHVDYCWRILIGLGCVPGAIALYFRLTIPETPRFTMDIERDVQRARTDIQNVLGDHDNAEAVYWVDPDAVVQHAEAPRRSRSDLIKYFGQTASLQLLFAVAFSWFATDAAFYGVGLNTSAISGRD